MILLLLLIITSRKFILHLVQACLRRGIFEEERLKLLANIFSTICTILYHFLLGTLSNITITTT